MGAQSVLDAYNLGQGGGGDCLDGLATAYPGAAYLTNPNACLNDIDGDGYSDVIRALRIKRSDK